MAMRLLLVGLLSTVAWAQSLSPSTVNFVARGQWSPPDQFTAVAASCGTVSVGSWSGDASLTGGVHTSIVGQTINVFLDGNTTYNLSFSTTGTLHTATSTVTFSGACSGTATLTVNVTVYTRTQTIFVYPGGSCVGCTGQSGFYEDPVTAMPTPMNPGNATIVAPPACPGGTWTDPVLGGTLTCVTPNGLNQALSGDSTNPGINADHTMVSVTQLGGVNSGSVYITKTDGSGTQCKTPAPSNIAPMYDPKLPGKMYFFSGLSLVSYTFTFAGCTFTGPTTVYTYPGSGSNISNSGDGMISPNGKLAFVVNGGDTVSGVIDVNAGTAVTRNYSSDPALGPLRGITYVSPGVSEATNKQYVHLDSNSVSTGSNEILDLTSNGTILTLEGPEARPPESIYANGGTPFLAYQPSTTSDCATYGNCQATQHACVFETRIGGKLHEMYIDNTGPIAVGQVVSSPIDLDAGVANGLRIVEDSGAGASGGAKAGGHYGNFPLDGANAANHYSCAQYAAVVAVSEESLPPSTYQITNVAVGNPPTVTVGSTTGLANTNVLLIGGVQGVTGMPSSGFLCTVASITGTTFQCNGLSTSGTYTANTGSAILNTAPSGPHMSEVIVMDFTQINAPRAIRVFHHNSLNVGDRLTGGYWAQAHVALSPDAQFACVSSNWGIPENIQVMCGPTGYPTPVHIILVILAAVAVQ